MKKQNKWFAITFIIVFIVGFFLKSLHLSVGDIFILTGGIGSALFFVPVLFKRLFQ
ncbi:hypothetical protein SAMN05421740_11466 [Parapedobacter koreensis]|uniref:Uncharacterized protein n=1 Tax=Parapedobacter koreensis TaxID=332977 RepID=A0A1H7UAD8_9SPHI|nr:hypothetical protein SAMN05421740_11466 [Parapedobacter koreensis]